MMRLFVAAAVGLLLLWQAPLRAEGSPYIAEVQQQLDALGYTVGAIDGEFDLALKSALTAFQRDHQLPANGLLDKKTRSEIAAAYAALPPRVTVVPPVTTPAPPAPVRPQPRPQPQPQPAPPVEPAPATAPEPEPAVATAPPAATPAPAAEQGVDFNWFVGGYLEFGGDDVATVSFTNGEAQDLTAGQGLSLAVGTVFRPRIDSPFSLRGALGYKYLTSQANNADISIGRVVIELLASMDFAQDWRFGVGPVRHMSIQYKADGLGPDLDFDDATGATVELGWRFVALSYTKIDYRDEFNNKYDAGNIGLRFVGDF